MSYHAMACMIDVPRQHGMARYGQCHVMSGRDTTWHVMTCVRWCGMAWHCMFWIRNKIIIIASSLGVVFVWCQCIVCTVVDVHMNFCYGTLRRLRFFWGFVFLCFSYRYLFCALMRFVLFVCAFCGLSACVSVLHCRTLKGARGHS